MDVSQVREKSSLFSIFLTFGVDQLGATIVFPIFAPLFLSPAQKLFDASVALSYKTTMLGIFLGVFPLMQFIFSPLLGEYADHHGRRKTLLLTTFLTFCGYGLCGVGIHYHSLFLIFFSRLMMGIGAGNLSICLSALSDLSLSPRKKVRYFSYGSAIAGVMFVLGPFIGGKLSDPQVSSWFDSSFPMFLGGVLGLANFLFLLVAFKETLKVRSTAPFDFVKSIRNIQLALKTRSIKNFYLIYFCYLFSWNIIFLFIPAFAVQNFSLTNSRIGDLCALLGLCWVFGTGVVHRLVDRFFHPKWGMVGAFLLFAAVVIFVPFPSQLWAFIALLAVCTVISGLIWPVCTGAISNAAPRNIQGKVMGLSQSMLSLTMMFASVLGGVFLQAHSIVPFLFSAISTVAAAVLVLIASFNPR
ncbi:MAG: MFS transporter [Chlamydiota bacterium]